MSMVMIENKVRVIPSVELMRLLGASSSRGSDELIGQFGSGFLHALALFAREGLLSSVKVTLGLDVYTFSLKRHNVVDSRGNKDVRREIIMHKQHGASIPLGIDTEFGALNWTSIGMAVREIISNAIDGAITYDSTTNSVVIKDDLPEHKGTRAKDGVIRVFFLANEEITEYLGRVQDTFLALRRDYKPTHSSVFVNKSGGPAKIYRKGVLVGEFGNQSLFNYDLVDLKLDEDRNVDSWEAARKAFAAIVQSGNVDIMKQYLGEAALKHGYSPYWEASFNTHTVKLWVQYASAENKAVWKQAMREQAADKIIAKSELEAKLLKAKGHEIVHADGDLAAALAEGGLKTAAEVLDADELSGQEIVPASETAQAVLDRVWGVVEAKNMSGGKEKPALKAFAQTTNADRLGSYRNNTVYVRSDIQEDAGIMLRQTIIEECGHHATGAMDHTRELQEWAFQLAAELMGG